jgi:hypothetical protein
MNRARIGALTAVVATVGVGSLTFTVLVPDPGTTALDLADAGIAAPNRVATCPVRVDPSCAAALGVRLYETVRFPVYREVLPDAGIALVLPPRIARASRCVEVVEWAHCDLDPVANFPAVAAKWDDPVPLTLARSSSKHAIPDCHGDDGGWVDKHEPVDCRRVELDGGSRWAGCNVLPRAAATGTQCLDAPTGTVFFIQGERLEDAL